MGTLLLTHWSACLERIHELYHGSEYEFLGGISGSVLLLERVDNETIRVGNLCDEAAIEDESKRLGIETFTTVSLGAFARAVIWQSEEFLDKLLAVHQESLDNDRWVESVRETISDVERDLQQNDV